MEHKVGYGKLKSELREQMVVNAGVMNCKHFRKRLRLYVQLKFGRIDDTMTKKQKRTRRISSTPSSARTTTPRTLNS
ncbi:hypothetical protein P3T76_013258 [Phytophthora citrophthora]|uniref:Uncharacterized protein n=1 Tax=Phytophthora citrophthora TaxID=4793 RepID=A0AAD9G307_9STRA|nr:hypothetical protein P3T76_013258 [Phytophthora citrophthora]